MKKNSLIAAVLALALAAIPVVAHVSGSEQKLYATNIAPDTAVSSLGGLSVKRGNKALASSDIIATNDIITRSGNEYVAIVLGDVNGDGIVNSTDFMQIRRAFLETFTLSDSAAKAADVNGDRKVNSTDFMAVRRHFLKQYTISVNGDVIFDQVTSEPTVSEESKEPSSVPDTPSHDVDSNYSVVIGPGLDESGWGPIF